MKKAIKSLALLSLLTSSTAFAAPIGFVIMRVYIPENGDISKVVLPNLTFEFTDGTTKEVPPCANPKEVTPELVNTLLVNRQPDCGWAVGVNTTRLLDPNVAFPDTSASYWATSFMPNDKLKKIVINGTYPNTRYLSFNTYDAKGSAFEQTIDGITYKSSIPDYKINPNAGFINPWQQPALAGGKYTVHIVRNPKTDAPLTANTLVMPPAIEGSLLTLLTQMPEVKNCNPTCYPINFFKPSKATASGAFPNSDSAYLMSMVKPKVDNVFVIRGKLPRVTAGDTPSTWPVDKQLRYFSICNNRLMKPYPVVEGACLRDDELKLDANNYYTIVVSHIKPVLHKHDWLPFSSLFPLQDHALLVRNMVSNPNFTQATLNIKDETNNWKIARDTMGEYYPTIKQCSRLDYALKGSGCKAIN